MRYPIGKSLITVAVVVLVTATAAAQEAPATKPLKPVSLYRVDFAIHESEDGKRVNTRTYMQLTEEGVGNWSRVRTGNRVPIRVPVSGGTEPTVQYMDVGVRIDCQLTEGDGLLRLELLWEVNSLAQEKEPQANPLLRTIRSDVKTAVLPGKPTVVSSVDDATSKRRYELEVTATKVK